MLFIKQLAKKYGSVLAIEALDLEIPRWRLCLVFLVETAQKKPLQCDLVYFLNTTFTFS